MEKQKQPLVCGLTIYSSNLKNMQRLRQENRNQVSYANVFMLGHATCVKLALACHERGDCEYGSQTASSILSPCTNVLFVAAAYLFLNLKFFI